MRYPTRTREEAQVGVGWSVRVAVVIALSTGKREHALCRWLVSRTIHLVMRLFLDEIEVFAVGLLDCEKRYDGDNDDESANDDGGLGFACPLAT